MIRDVAEKLLNEHGGIYHSVSNIMFIGKPGTTEVRPINLDELTVELAREYFKYLGDLQK